jgi:uncharacterized surface protein with fasciclin (FAS1) repeats
MLSFRLFKIHPMEDKRMKSLLTLALLLGIAFQSNSFAAEAKKKAATAKTSKTEKAEKAVADMPIKIQILDMSGESGKDIVEIAIDKGFTTLVAAVKAADLVDDLQGAGPYTVFAPTDAAFAKLPKETIPNLLKPENKTTLENILQHHTAVPKFMPEFLAQQKELDMADGGPKLKVENKDGHLYIDGNELKVAVLAKNGIIYVVDNVILAK